MCCYINFHRRRPKRVCYSPWSKPKSIENTPVQVFHNLLNTPLKFVAPEPVLTQPTTNTSGKSSFFTCFESLPSLQKIDTYISKFSHLEKFTDTLGRTINSSIHRSKNKQVEKWLESIEEL